MVFFSMCEFFTQAALDNASRHGFEDGCNPTNSLARTFRSWDDTVAFFGSTTFAVRTVAFFCVLCKIAGVGLA